MIKAAFLNETPDTLRRVYAERQMARLNKLVQLYPAVITSVDEARAARDALKDVEVVFSTWGMPAMTEAEIKECFPSLKAVFYGAGSVQYFARPFLNAGVRVYSAWQANAVPVVQYAFAQILLATKGYFRVQPLTRADRSAGHKLFENYPGNYDVKIGLLGCGAIGSRLAEMLRQIDCEVLVFDPFLSEERAEKLHVKKAEMAEIFAECDVISNHLANLPATVGIIKREYFLSMKPYATFINTGRGPQLDEKDLYDALTTVPTRTALLDVMTNEGHSNENPLNALENCFITPHIAGSSGLEVRRMAEYMMDAFELYAKNEPCSYEVTTAMLETMA